jgi:preprotein translocase subunit SecE
MKQYTGLIIWSVVVLAAFAIAWRMGWIRRFSRYVQETREELRKCTWPTRQELWGSTVLVMVATAILGVFTVIVDAVVAYAITSLFSA